MGNKLGPLVFIDTKIKKDVYTVLEQNLLGYIDVLIVEGLQDILFQQDNVSPHAATIIRNGQRMWEEREHGFTVMEWPAISPDLNPIENLWAQPKLELHQHYPDTKYLHGSPETVKGILKERLNKVQWDFREEVLNRLIESMPEYVQARLEVRGQYTRF